MTAVTDAGTGERSLASVGQRLTLREQNGQFYKHAED